MIFLQQIVLLLIVGIFQQSLSRGTLIDQINPNANRQINIGQWITSIFLPRPPQINSAGNVQNAIANCPKCQCGITKRHPRVVGGYEAIKYRYPWMALLKFRGESFCAGSVISDRFILTSARCVRGFSKEMLQVVLMAHQREAEELQGSERQVVSVLVHPEYSPHTYDNDIGLIKVNERMKFEDALRPVCLPMPHMNYDGEEGTVLGWGMTSENGYLADALQEVKVPILPQDSCRASKYGKDRITDNMMCAGLEVGGKDACQGDSGGPLLVRNSESNVLYLAGIVSWGEGCARPEFPGVYTRVNRFLKWIADNIEDSCLCNGGVR